MAPHDWSRNHDKEDKSLERPSRHGTYDSGRDVIGDLDKIHHTEIQNQQGDWPDPPEPDLAPDEKKG